MYEAVVCLLSVLIFAVVCGTLGPQPTDLSDRCYSRAVLVNIYRDLHDSVKNDVVGCDSAEQHVELLTLGRPLKYDSFNPGRRKQPQKILGQSDSLPISVVENALPLVDKIFPTKTFTNTDTTKSQSDYNYESLSSTFSYILRHMMVRPKNFSSDEVLKAKYYLQELVPNSEKVLIKDAHSLPRLLLYDYYRIRYFEESSKRDSQINRNHVRLTQSMFEEWGKKELSPLTSNVDAAYTKWQVLGYKIEVENQLQYFDVDRQEDKLMSTKALFRAAARSSERDPHITVYPFTFYPEDWYKILKSQVAESSDELRYRKSLLETEQALLNASREQLNDISGDDIKYTLNRITKRVAELDKKVQNAVDKLLQYEIECFTGINSSACDVIVNGNIAFERILDNIAEHFEQASYLQSLLNSRENNLKVINIRLQNFAAQIETLEAKIQSATLQQIKEDVDVSSYNNLETRSCPSDGKALFTFDGQNTVIGPHACSDTTHLDKLEEELPDCPDERVPVNISNSLLWSVSSCSVDNQLHAFGLYDNFTRLMNSAPAKITASLSKVDIHRPWFDDNIFKHWEHFTMNKGSGIVSPGILKPGRYYQEVVRNGQYLMPQYTSAMILASNIRIDFPGLGVWNDSDTDNQINSAINILMKYAYAPNVQGGYGPYSFVPSDSTSNKIHNFRVERSRGGILITLHGAQVIGFITTVIPFFPSDQPVLDNYNMSHCQEQPASSNSAHDSPSGKKRRRRSVGVKGNTGVDNDLDMLQIANSMFSESLSLSDSFLHKNGFISAIQNIRRLINEVEMSKDRVNDFIKNAKDNQEWTFIPSEDEPFSAYQNGTWKGKSQVFP